MFFSLFEVQGKLKVSLHVISKSLVATSLKSLRESSKCWSRLMSLKFGKRTLSPSHGKLVLSVSLSCQSKQCSVDFGSKSPLYNFKSAPKVIKKDSSSFFKKVMLTDIFFVSYFPNYRLWIWHVCLICAMIVCKLAKRRESKTRALLYTGSKISKC